jgi:hypothetical protein
VGRGRGEEREAGGDVEEGKGIEEISRTSWKAMIVRRVSETRSGIEVE